MSEMISYLEWQHVEDYNFYRIGYVLNGYYHKVFMADWNVETDIPTFISKRLNAEICCEPIERVYR